MTAWIGIILSVIMGIVMMTTGISTTSSYGSSTVSGVVPGIFTIVLGALFSWLGSLTMYGFGELIQKVTAIEENTSKKA